MSIITFLNGNKEQTGKTMSLVAIATNLAIEYNYKILLISTTNKKDLIKGCFWDGKTQKNTQFRSNNFKNGIDTESGAIGLGRIVRSNKITAETITNYTKSVFKDRLEILLGNEDEENELEDIYFEIVNTANQHYDLVFVDLDENITGDIRKNIIDKSDIIITTISQRLQSLNSYLELKETMPILKSKKNLTLITRYDKFSKYNIKNITKYLGEKNQVLTVPYNTLFFEASEEAKVPDLFLKLRRNIDPTDRNSIFISEVQRAVKNIMYRLEDIQIKY